MNEEMENQIPKQQLSDEFFAFIAIFLIVLYSIFSREKQFIKDWKKFSSDLHTKNRFSSDNKVIETILNLTNEHIIQIDKGYNLYRARKITAAEIPILRAISEDEWLIFKLTHAKTPDDKLAILKDKKNESFLDNFKKCKHSGFWGFNKRQSGAPPSKKTGSGRFNPQGIRYLYVAESYETAIAEKSPLISETLSIAALKLKKTLKVVDFTQFRDVSQNDVDFTKNAKNALANVLSEVALMKEDDYLPMQYIAEKIKNIGIDGIRFSSSLHRGGINIVLFDPACCDIIGSTIYEVEEVTYKTKQKLPFAPDIEAPILCLEACLASEP